MVSEEGCGGEGLEEEVCVEEIGVSLVEGYCNCWLRGYI